MKNEGGARRPGIEKASRFVTEIATDIGRFSEPLPPPWQQMVLCSVSTFAPLVFGAFRGEMPFAIYGALAGYLLALNDHVGAWLLRMMVVTLTLLVMSFGVGSMLLLAPYPEWRFFIIALIVYWVGLFGTEGAELERAFLFAAVAMVLAQDTAGQFQPFLKPIAFYALLALGSFGVTSLLLVGLQKLQGYEDIFCYVPLRSSLLKILTRDPYRHLHAVTYLAAITGGFILNRALEMERGYWVLITILLVMKPDRHLSVRSTLQRLFGTLSAIAFYDFMRWSAREVLASRMILIFSLAILAWMIPYWLKRSYLIASFLVTELVVFLLQLALPDVSMAHLSHVRLKATALGCALALAGTLISAVIERFFLRSPVGGKSKI